jgi:hypothetical protein
MKARSPSSSIPIKRSRRKPRSLVAKARWTKAAGLRELPAMADPRVKRLNDVAIRTAERLRRQDFRVARWIAADALRELRSDAVQARLRRRGY